MGREVWSCVGTRVGDVIVWNPMAGGGILHLPCFGILFMLGRPCSEEFKLECQLFCVGKGIASRRCSTCNISHALPTLDVLQNSNSFAFFSKRVNMYWGDRGRSTFYGQSVYQDTAIASCKRVFVLSARGSRNAVIHGLGVPTK